MAAAQVAREMHLPDEWLNNAVQRFLGRRDRNPIPALDLPGLRVMVASPRYLLAMKILADRHQRDRDDIRFLIRHLGFRKAEEIVESFADVYPYEPIPADTMLRIEEILAELV